MEGNQMKMREALYSIQEYAAAMDADDGNVLAILDACRDALDAPPRQCDVGTWKEQETRFENFCQQFRHDYCRGCSLGEMFYRNHEIGECRLAWAQTPYEAQEGAGK